MAVKETIVYTRPSTDILWPWESIPSISNTEVLFVVETSLSEDKLVFTSIRTWNSVADFVNEKSKQTTVTSNKQFFNYIINNNFKLVRTFEVI